METTSSPAQLNVRPNVRTLGIFTLLVFITIMPKGIGHLICAFLGAAGYLLFLMLQPTREILSQTTAKAGTAVLSKIDDPAYQCGQGPANPNSMSQTVIPSASSMKIDAIKGPDDEATTDGGEAIDQNLNDENPIDEETTDDIVELDSHCLLSGEPADGSPIDPPQCDDHQQPPNLGEEVKDSEEKRKRLVDVQRQIIQLIAKNAKDAAQARAEARAEGRAEHAFAHTETAFGGGKGPTENVPSFELPMMETNWIGDINGVTHAEMPIINPFCNQVCGVELVPFMHPVCMPDNCSPTTDSTEILNPLVPPHQAEDWNSCWDWVTRGWCPRGTACRWAHPQENNNDAYFWSNFGHSNEAANFNGMCKMSDADLRVAKATNFDIDYTDNFKHDGARGTDDDGYMTDDGF